MKRQESSNDEDHVILGQNHQTGYWFPTLAYCCNAPFILCEAAPVLPLF